MTLLEIIQAAALELGLNAPSSVVNSDDLQALQLLALANREGKEARSKVDWPQLSKEYTFTLSASTADYALPADFERFNFQTHWDRSNHWEILGPLSPEEWQWRKSGIVNSAPRRRWRVKGFTASQLSLDPTPPAADAGQTMVYEYQTRSWCSPRLWVTGLAVASGSYIAYNGNIYTATSAGTTGATAPTHTSGSMSDGAVTWAYSSAAYETFRADTDISQINDDLIILGIKWRFLMMKGLDWEVHRADHEAAMKRMSTDLKGAPRLSITRTPSEFLIGYNNIPDSGYG